MPGPAGAKLALVRSRQSGPASDEVSGPHKLPPRRFGGRWGWFDLALVATTVVITLLVARRLDRHPGEPAGWSSTDAPRVVYDDTGAMTFADGSTIRMRDGGRMRLERVEPRAVEVTLEHGTADAQVVHVEGRRFVVHTGAFDVVDTGTRFVVSLDEGVVRVSVGEGHVEVRDVSGALPVRVLATGESWSTTSRGAR